MICTTATYRVSLSIPPVLTTCVLASSKAPTGGSFTAAFHNLPLRSAPGGHLERTNVLIWPSHYIQITTKEPLICNVYDYDWPPRPALASCSCICSVRLHFRLLLRFLSFMAPNVYTSLRVRQKMQFIKRRIAEFDGIVQGTVVTPLPCSMLDWGLQALLFCAFMQCQKCICQSLLSPFDT